MIAGDDVDRRVDGSADRVRPQCERAGSGDRVFVSIVEPQAIDRLRRVGKYRLRRRTGPKNCDLGVGRRRRIGNELRNPIEIVRPIAGIGEPMGLDEIVPHDGDIVDLPGSAAKEQAYVHRSGDAVAIGGKGIRIVEVTESSAGEWANQRRQGAAGGYVAVRHLVVAIIEIDANLELDDIGGRVRARGDEAGGMQRFDAGPIEDHTNWAGAAGGSRTQKHADPIRRERWSRARSRLHPKRRGKVDGRRAVGGAKRDKSFANVCGSEPGRCAGLRIKQRLAANERRGRRHGDRAINVRGKYVNVLYPAVLSDEVAR